MARTSWNRIGQRVATWGANDSERELLARVRALTSVPAIMAELNEGETAIAASDEDANERWDRRNRLETAIIYRLADLDSEKAANALATLIDGGSDELRRLASARLADSPRKSAIPRLAKALDDRDDAVRSNAAWGLSAHGYLPAVPKIVAMLESPRMLKRVHAAHALARLGDRSAEPALRRARRREWRPWVRFSMPRRVQPRGQQADRPT